MLLIGGKEGPIIGCLSPLAWLTGKPDYWVYGLSLPQTRDSQVSGTIVMLISVSEQTSTYRGKHIRTLLVTWCSGMFGSESVGIDVCVKFL